ncbi:MAG: sodium/glutamate symporter [Ignavibacteriales bacterium]|nr:sodium/glutamate symporter [Ignavibacteriales bacterium]
MPTTEILTLKLDIIQTLAIACVVYFLGMVLRRNLPILERLNIPSAVIGGLLFAALNLLLHDRFLNLKFETATQPLFMVLFFTTIGVSASLPLLKKGGVQVLIFLIMSTVFCFVQNFVGMGISSLFGVHPLLGVMAGSVTLVGGPATGLAFAPLFEQAGLTGAGTLAITAATFGIVCGGILGGPVGTSLIKRYNLRASKSVSKSELQHELADESPTISVEIEREDSNLVMTIIIASAAMGLGSIVSYYFQSLGWTLPAYIGAMLVASIFRNVDDGTKWLKIDQQAMELIGTIALNIFLVVALMDLKLWELLHLAGPLTAILLAQVIVVVLFSLTFSFWVMGKDYESAVMASGFIGFVLGTTANAVANMKTLVGKYGAAPRAFLIVPMVGAFFIDFTNALIITGFLNWLK